MPELEERQAKVEGVLEQIDKRLDHLESDVSSLRSEINSLRDEMHSGMNSLRGEIGELRAKIDTNFRWLVGIMITMWVTMILAIIFKA
ncbi:MAG TPA: hypothetical protein VI387_12125 [Candidatus Brocadiales bacterium]|nr:hypothetical protein [Candidatus Brocadiales bacterium]